MTGRGWLRRDRHSLWPVIDASTINKCSVGGALRVWTTIAFLRLRGPPGKIAVMHRASLRAENDLWVSKWRFLDAPYDCILRSGPKARNLNRRGRRGQLRDRVQSKADMVWPARLDLVRFSPMPTSALLAILRRQPATNTKGPKNPRFVQSGTLDI